MGIHWEYAKIKKNRWGNGATALSSYTTLQSKVNEKRMSRKLLSGHIVK